MDYRLFVFVSEKEISGYDLDSQEYVSIEGNSFMLHRNNMSSFANYIKEYYNIDCFEDIEIKISIINCDANNNTVFDLVSELKSAKSLDLISAKAILPILATNEKQKLDSKKEYAILDTVYAVTISRDGNVSVEKDNNNSSEKVLTGADFSFLDVFNVKKICNDIEAENKYNILHKKNSELEKINSKLTSEIDSFHKEHEKAIGLQNEYNILKEKMKTIEGRTLVNVFWDSSYSAVADFKVDGELVEPGTVLAVLHSNHEIFPSKSSKYRKVKNLEVVSSKKGIFCPLYESRTHIYSGTHFGIFIDVNDTREDAIEWYKNLFKNVTE